MSIKISSILLLFGCLVHQTFQTRYQPTWESIDSRPLPEWYDDCKVGIFMHLGVYSVPAFENEWFWHNWQSGNPDQVNYMKKNYKPDFTYQDFAKELTMEFFNPQQWVDLFQKAGAKYTVLTTKHHEGYTLWPSKRSYSWNAMDVGPKRDIVGEFSNAVHATKGELHLGLYHSLFEWYHPLFLQDRAANFTTRLFPEIKAMPELNELVMNYKPDIIWSDTDIQAPAEYWKSQEWLAWLYNDSPIKDTVVVNDRWGKYTNCHHGGYLTCTDRYQPVVRPPRKWESAYPMDGRSWAARDNGNIQDYLTIKQIITFLVKTVSNGGNFLLDIGPTKQGTISPLEQERLLQMGDWLKTNGQAIYNTTFWKPHWNDTLTKDVYFTESKDQKVLNAITLNWPEDEVIDLGAVSLSSVSSIKLLGYDQPLRFQKSPKATDGIRVILPPMAKVQNLSQAWTLAIQRKPSL